MTNIGIESVAHHQTAVQVGKLSFNCEDVLGKGSFGTVFRGTFQNATEVAIKRIIKLEVNKFETDIMTTIDHHSNIIHYYSVEEDDDFM